MTNQEIIDYIKNSPKKGLKQVYVEGENLPEVEGGLCVGDESNRLLVGKASWIEDYLQKNRSYISDYSLYTYYHQSGVALYNPLDESLRIEPGAMIREKVTLCKGVIVMMNASINIGAYIGENTMIDMNAVVGANAIIKSHCHIGAGSVIAGTLEPASAKPVIIENHVLIGANAVILEGVHIGENSIIGAGSVVTKDVAKGSVVYGTSASLKKSILDVEQEKYQINEELRWNK